jgi:hypothetical protein
MLVQKVSNTEVQITLSLDGEVSSEMQVVLRAIIARKRDSESAHHVRTGRHVPSLAQLKDDFATLETLERSLRENGIEEIPIPEW